MESGFWDNFGFLGSLLTKRVQASSDTVRIGPARVGVDNPSKASLGADSVVKLFSTSCETRFLGWDAPLLPVAATTLRQRFAHGNHLDLSNFILVLPTSHSASQMSERLRATAESEQLHYLPPKIITVGQLAEQLYEPPHRIALELERTLAWAQVLRTFPPDELEPLLPVIPAPEPVAPWMEIAGAINRLHEELATSQFTFQDVIELAETNIEQRRWKLLNKTYNAYLASLEAADLCDPYAARQDAVLHNRCRCDQTIVLIGTSDLSEALIAMLRSLENNLIALVAAPPNEASRFDELGCVDTSHWLNQHLPIQDHQLIAAQDMADQAKTVAELLAELAGDYYTNEVTLGVTDESHVGPIEMELRCCGVKPHRHLGWTVAETSIGRLLDLVSAHLARGTWSTLAALVRHADVSGYVSRHLGIQPIEWLKELDQLLSEFFPIRVSDPLSKPAIKKCPLVQSVAKLIGEWLLPLTEHERSIADWSGIVSSWLLDLFPLEMDDLPAEETDDRQALEKSTLHDRTHLAMVATQRLLKRYAELNDQLDLTVSGATAIEMLSARLADVRIAEPKHKDDVSILGWLDLALDDSKLLVVNGLNHPFVPSSVTSDPFLPGSLRNRLRMEDHNRRYARDAYAMHLMITTRPAVRFIVGSTAADLSPTPPSRLLASAPGIDIARRIRKLLGEQRPAQPVNHQWDMHSSDRRLPIPKLPIKKDVPAVTSMSVTAFADYLRCPYRFYLRHVLKFKPLDDEANELAANQFGNLVHAALEEFGLSDDRDEGNADKIEAILANHLNQFASQYYGKSVSTAVQLQIAQAQRRFKAVARQQAQRIAEGWRIHATEASVSERDGAFIEVDNRKMGLRGRFDRIDHHPGTGRWAILDYKTHGFRPEKKHLKKTDDGHRWIDLQLPLYRLMIPYLGIDAVPDQVQLGYFNVSEKEEDTRINIAGFTPDQMRQAEQVIRDCVSGIWAGNFQPASDRIQYDDYGMILQTSVANRLLDQVEWLSGPELES